MEDKDKISKEWKREERHPKIMDINKAHDVWGHKGKDLVKKTSKHNGIQLAVKVEQCEGCGRPNAKDVCKTTIGKA